ncbi:MAG: GFA family protein [Betaproteobacteria bacterium]
MNPTFHGSCHCGSVRFACDLDLSQGTSRCNCSMCAKTRLWKAVAAPGSFRLLQGADAVATYRFGSERVEHRFCRHCGVKLGGHGAKGAFPEAFDVVSIACLDDMADDVKAALAVAWQDGRHDDWAHAPATTASL